MTHGGTVSNPQAKRALDRALSRLEDGFLLPLLHVNGSLKRWYQLPVIIPYHFAARLIFLPLGLFSSEQGPH